MTPEQAVAGWRGSPPHNALMINEGVWSTPWKAIGVAIHKGVAHVWFGREADPTGVPVIDLSTRDSGTQTAGNATGNSGNDVITVALGKRLSMAGRGLT